MATSKQTSRTIVCWKFPSKAPRGISETGCHGHCHGRQSPSPWPISRGAWVLERYDISSLIYSISSSLRGARNIEKCDISRTICGILNTPTHKTQEEDILHHLPPLHQHQPAAPAATINNHIYLFFRDLNLYEFKTPIHNRHNILSQSSSLYHIKKPSKASSGGSASDVWTIWDKTCGQV